MDASFVIPDLIRNLEIIWLKILKTLDPASLRQAQHWEVRDDILAVRDDKQFIHKVKSSCHSSDIVAWSFFESGRVV